MAAPATATAMGGRVSPGGALLRTSRMFALPRPLPEPSTADLRLSNYKSATMTKQHPQHQSITSPLSSREKGDWGIKRPFPLKSTMTTSTPIMRIKQVDAVENVTDLASAADHSLSLEKFQEMRIALTTPRNNDKKAQTGARADMFPKSVFEEDMDVTDLQQGRKNSRRWKFEGPWLARMTEGQFIDYVNSRVRPNRAGFRQMLAEKLADDITTSQANRAMEAGKPAPIPVKPEDITAPQFTDFLRSLRNDRVTLYSLISKYLDLAPLGQPSSFLQTFWSVRESAATENPWGKSGPPPCHPSAGISYLRTNSFMENHPVYGPQSRKTPVLARVIAPRHGAAAAKLGVGGFVADAPSGDNEFNIQHGRWNSGHKMLLKGIMHLDTTTHGGAKAHVEPQSASVDPSGKVILRLHETHQEAQLIAKESKGLGSIYMTQTAKDEEKAAQKAASLAAELSEHRRGRISDELVSDDI